MSHDLDRETMEAFRCIYDTMVNLGGFVNSKTASEIFFI